VIELPQGRYLSCTFGVSPDAAGQTRALLMRNRFLASEGGVRPTVLALGGAPDYDERRRILLERGLLNEQVALLNLYDHYRDHGWGDAEPAGEPLPDLSARKVGEEARSDGTPWRISYRLPDSGRLVYDYLRADGTPFLRIPRYGIADRSTWRCAIHKIGPDGRPVGELGSVGRFFRQWIRELAEGHERTFLFIDSRFVIPHLVPLRARAIHVVYQMHNMHLEPPRRWDSDTNPVYRRVLARIDDMDAMVTLTERQRDDIAERRGRTDHMFVVPNPVDVPPLPDPPPPRDPRRVTIMARLETQKRLVHAIGAFQRVVEAVPEARLDIFGEGTQREKLQREIDRADLTGSVTLRGFDPAAREALWRSSAFLMTSEYEGYPLSTLESMSHGCPVVSYDVRYGPREQITDGVDGFVVPEGDQAALADRVVELLRSPDLVARMSAAAREKVADYGPAEFVERWSHVLRAVVELAPHRTRIEEAVLELERLRLVRDRGWRRRLGNLAPGRVGAGGALELAGVLRVKGRGDLDAGRLELAAIRVGSGEVVDLPLVAERADDGFRLAATVPLADVLPAGEPGAARLRLRLVWRNAAWQTDVAVPAADGEVAMSFGPGGVVQLAR
jgi:poly(glycerol-phosphate) alpha-glucosyltransferase